MDDDVVGAVSRNLFVIYTNIIGIHVGLSFAALGARRPAAAFSCTNMLVYRLSHVVNSSIQTTLTSAKAGACSAPLVYTLPLRFGIGQLPLDCQIDLCNNAEYLRDGATEAQDPVTHLSHPRSR